MATKKKAVKVRDMKPLKDAKGGGFRALGNTGKAGSSTAGRTTTAGRSRQ